MSHRPTARSCPGDSCLRTKCLRRRIRDRRRTAWAREDETTGERGQLIAELLVRPAGVVVVTRPPQRVEEATERAVAFAAAELQQTIGAQRPARRRLDANRMPPSRGLPDGEIVPRTRSGPNIPFRRRTTHTSGPASQRPIVGQRDRGSVCASVLISIALSVNGETSGRKPTSSCAQSKPMLSIEPVGTASSASAATPRLRTM